MVHPNQKKDVEAPITDHDQLPSIEDAKINNAIANSPGHKAWWKVASWIALCVVMMVLILLATTLAVTSEEDGVSSVEEMVGPSTTAADPQFQQVVNVLMDVSTAKDLHNPTGPQNRAATWMAHHDPLSQILLTDNNNNNKLRQRYILALFFLAMGGKNWEKDLNFFSVYDECHWFTFDESQSFVSHQMFVGVLCNEEGNVKQLRFPDGYLVGDLPEELNHLTDLEHVELSHNPGIQGGFPSFLQSLKKLKYVGLQHCGLQGNLPSWLGDLTSVETLVLSNNEFMGALPSSLALLTNMQYLYLDDNKLEGDIGIFSAMTDLRHLILEDNMITGTLQESTMWQWPNLETLDLSHNQLGSTLPQNLWSDLPNLRVVDIHGNQFSGSLPSVPPSAISYNLEFLAVNNNLFTGNVPSSFGNFDKLKHLDVSTNKLESSALPESLGSLTNLEYLFVANNNPSQQGATEIPTFLRNLTNLVDLSLKNTNLVGNIPEWIGTDLINLQLLDLDNNSLVGSIPSSLGGLTSLKHLLLNRNKLEGTIPSSLVAGAGRLETLLVDKNELTGTTDEICAEKGQRAPAVFVADCGGAQPAVTCDCCSLCCKADDPSCNDDMWLGDIDLIWEHAYKRGGDDYNFDGPAP